jgi:HKD family nuclease
MQVSFLTGERAESELLALTEDCDSMEWAVAWATPNRLVDAAFEHRAKLKRLVVGTHMYQTHPDVLTRFRSEPQLKVMPPSGDLFHPKAYLFRTGTRVHAVVGSHNLTQSAMRRNVEASMLFEGEEGELSLQALSQFIGKAWADAAVLDDDFLYRYRQQYQATAGARRALNVFTKTPLPADPTSGKAPFTLTWAAFVEDISRNRGKFTLQHRLTILETVDELFSKHSRFNHMAQSDRQLVAGTAGSVQALQGGTDFRLFGAMPNGGFSSLVNRAPEGFSEALDLIPAAGPVGEHHYDAYIRRFEKSFIDQATERKGALPSASRLLAMKRPDVFVCVSNANKAGLCANFGVRKTNLAMDNYWQSIVAPLMQTEWWQTPAPAGGVELSIWKGRAALLDLLYWVPGGKDRFD